jgi:hypothetical protein
LWNPPNNAQREHVVWVRKKGRREFSKWSPMNRRFEKEMVRRRTRKDIHTLEKKLINIVKVYLRITNCSVNP